MTEPKPPVSSQGEGLPPELNQALDRHAEAMDARMSEALRQLDESLGKNNVPKGDRTGEASSAEAELDAQQARGMRKRGRGATQTNEPKEVAPELPAASPKEEAPEEMLLKEGEEKYYQDKDGVVWKVEKKADLYAVSGHDGNGNPEESGFVYDEQMIRTLVSEWKATPFSQVITAFQSTEAAPEKVPTLEWTLGRLLLEVPEGRFMLTSPEGGENTRTHRYKRDGGSFLNKKGKEKEDEILDRLNQGWTMTLESQEEKEVPKVVAAAPLSPEPVIPEERSFERNEKRGEFVFESQDLSLASPSHPESNQDRVLNMPELGVFAVFDGVGGEEGGEKAAETARNEVKGFIERYGQNLRSLEEAKDILRHAILSAQDAILQAKTDNPELADMATTATMGFMFEGKLLVASVGDSRLYRARQGKFEQLSVDDSLIPEELRAKFNNVVNPQAELTSDELEIWKNRNKITNALGSEHFQEPTIEVFDVAEGDQYLLSSDGLTDPITDNDLQAALAQENPFRSLTQLAERAKEGGIQALEGEKNHVERNSRDKADDVSFVLVNVKNKGEQQKEKSEAVPEGQVRLEKAVREMVKEGEVERGKEVLQQKIDALKIEVAEFRYKYAEMDYEKTSAWKTLRGFFRNMTSNGAEDADTRYWASEYQSKLMELKNLELEQVKQEGLKGEALKERMAGVIQYYKYEQAAALYNDRTQVIMERKGWVKKAWGKWEEAVKAYGRLSLSKKIMVGVGLAGVTLATGGVGGAAVLVLRRAMGATGIAMATDAALAAIVDKKEQKKVKKEVEEFEKKFFFSDDLEQTLENYSGLLSDEILELNQKLQKKKLEALVRKAAAANVGILVGIALPSAVGHMMAGDEVVAGGSHAPAATTPSEAPSSAPAGTPGIEGGEEPGTADQASEAPAQEVVSFERYEVTADDGKRGLWGIIDNHLPEDLPQAERNRIIQSLENAIQQKLDTMSPAEQTAAGFRGGHIGNIYADTQIDFEKLLTPEEIQSVMDGKSITLSHAEVASSVVDQSGSTDVPETSHAASPEPEMRKDKPIFDTTNPLHSGSGGIATASESAVHEKVSFTDPKAYLREHPEALSQYNGTLGRLRMGIFMLPPTDAPVALEYDYTSNGEKLGNTQVENVLRDLKAFRGGFLQNLNYDRIKNPLHFDQMTALSKFLEASEEAFGKEMAKVENGESIDHYTRRMATAALRMGKEIKGFYKP